MRPVVGQLYADGQRDDGRLLPFPTDDQSVIFQRTIIREMCNEGENAFACNDPVTGKPLTNSELFDMYSLAMLVIHEVESHA